MKANNFVQVIGNIGFVGELRIINSDRNVIQFSVATNTFFKNDKGERVERTQWHNWTAFGKKAEIVKKHLKAGSRVCVTGSMNPSKYVNKENIEVYKIDLIVDDVIFL